MLPSDGYYPSQNEEQQSIKKTDIEKMFVFTRTDPFRYTIYIPQVDFGDLKETVWYDHENNTAIGANIVTTQSIEE